jgi:hypothetical protein
MDTKEYDQFELEILPVDNIRATLVTQDNLKRFAAAKVVKEEDLLDDIRKNISKLKAGELDGKMEEIQTLGRDLYRTIFPGKVGILFEQALQTVINDRRRGNKNRCLRVVIDVDSTSEVFSWPLEFLYCKPMRFWLATEKPMIALSRRTKFDTSVVYDLNPQTPPLRVLVIISKPENEDLGGVITTKILEEIGELAETELSDPGSEEVIRIKIRVLGQIECYEKNIPGIDHIDRPATYGNITELIDKLATKDEQPHVLHFIGHGESDKGLALVDDTGRVEWCSAELISRLFTDWFPRLILLQACEGAMKDPAPGFISLADHLIQRGIPAVVAMQSSIMNAHATSFATGFYKALRDGKDVDEAVQEGRWTIWNKVRGSEPSFGTPVLFTYDPTGIILLQEPSAPALPRQPGDRTSLRPRGTATPLVQQALHLIEIALSWLKDEDYPVDEDQARICMEGARNMLQDERPTEARIVDNALTCLNMDADVAKRMLEHASHQLGKPDRVQQPSIGSAQPIRGGQERRPVSGSVQWKPQPTRISTSRIYDSSRIDE